jgi:hypothetical protein
MAVNLTGVSGVVASANWEMENYCWRQVPGSSSYEERGGWAKG